MNKEFAYTYLLGWTKQNMWYYGCRYAKGCNPSELWIKYKTSSKHVKVFAEKYGDPDIVKIRKIFTSIQKSREWEHKALRRINAVKRKDFLNKTDNISICPEAARKGSLNQKGKPKNHTEQGLKNISIANSKPYTPEEYQTMIPIWKRNGERRKGISTGPESEETRNKKRIAHTGGTSGMLGKTHPRCSCIICRKEHTYSSLVAHYKQAH